MTPWGIPRGMLGRRDPKRFCSYLAMVNNISESKPSTFEEATNQQVWKDAMVEEYNSPMNNDAWEVVLRPEGNQVVNSKWLYKIQRSVDGNIKKYKVQFEAKGFS